MSDSNQASVRHTHKMCVYTHVHYVPEASPTTAANPCTCHSNFYYPALHYAPPVVQAQPAPAAVMF